MNMAGAFKQKFGFLQQSIEMFREQAKKNIFSPGGNPLQHGEDIQQVNTCINKWPDMVCNEYNRE